MKIHEYQAKELFAKHGIAVPQSYLAITVEEALHAAKQLDRFPLAVKAQIHAGGRGKGGGVRLAHSLDELRQSAEDILGMTLITPQTGAAGRTVGKILVEEGVHIASELYLSIIPDRATAQIAIVASTSGGMDIEEVAASTPEKIITVQVNPLVGIQPFHLRQLVFGLGLGGEVAKGVSTTVKQLYQVFMDYDCTLVEVNPLVITTDNQVVALDAKIDVDSNALFRQPEILAFRDPDEEEPLEAEAASHNLSYIKLDGNVGNMVNGAGLAMATMDLIMKSGAAPANFLDVGGGANAEMVEQGFRIILGDPNVRGVLINIFGGILRCDVLARGVVEAATKVEINVPLIVRMEGTNVEEGRRILAASDLDIITAVDLLDAAEKVAALVNA